MGSGSSFDLKTLVPGIDYSSLTSDNFIVGTSGISRTRGSYVDGSYCYYPVVTLNSDLTKSYNSGTGVLTLSGGDYTLYGGAANAAWCSGAGSVGTTVVPTKFAYLVIGTINTL